ncbi:MAG: hypothetical protein HOO95_02310 [Gallionella sp.]|nr:hypothetical protein [Gallionella sp.]
MRSFIFLPMSLCMLAVCCTTANAESLIYDPVSGNYTYSYEVVGGVSTTTYTPASAQIVATVTSSMSLINTTQVRYDYTLANGAMAKAGLSGFVFRGIPNLLVGELAELPNQTMAQVDALYASYHQAITTPPNWTNGIARDASKAYSSIHWFAENEQLVNGVQVLIPETSLGIPPSATQSGFGFTSLDLPGINPARLQGPYSIIAYADEGPEDPQDGTLNPLQTLQGNDFVPRNAAAPMIAVPTPYDAAVTLENIQTHVHTWIAKQLLNATFSAQLDTSFLAAIAAYRANQPQTAIIQLQTMRTLIKQQQPDADKNDTTPTINLTAPPALIDLLAARILYFDLGYVMQR